MSTVRACRKPMPSASSPFCRRSRAGFLASIFVVVIAFSTRHQSPKDVLRRIILAAPGACMPHVSLQQEGARCSSTESRQAHEQHETVEHQECAKPADNEAQEDQRVSPRNDCDRC